MFGYRLDRKLIEQFCEEYGVIPLWDEPIKPGDNYLAYRNTGIKSLICREVANGCVFPTTVAYPFNTGECVKVGVTSDPQLQTYAYTWMRRAGKGDVA